MKSVEEIAIETYQNNVSYFARQHPELHKLITSFGEMLDNGMYESLYDLEYINDYFDIKNIKTNDHIYNENSTKFAKEIAKEVSFKKNRSVFNIINIKYSSEEFLSTYSDRTSPQNSMYELVNYCLDNSSKDDTMQEIKKFIFIGVGLGQHIESVDKKIKSSEYLIIEDNLEFFRLSLFVTKYYKLGEHSKLHFCVAQDDVMFSRSMQNFVDSNFVSNKQLKYLHLGMHSQEKIKQIQNIIISQDFLSFPYGLRIKKHLRALEFINSGYNILDLTEHFSEKFLVNKPMLLIAAGPSFEKHLTWIRNNQNKFVIVAVSAVLKRLFEVGVKPDIVTHLDGFIASTLYFEGFDVKSFLKDTVFIFEAFTPTCVREMFPKENIFQFEGDTYYSNSKRSISAPCIGTLSVLISLQLNVKELYTVGLDLAVNQETGETHSSKQFFNESINIKNKETFSKTVSLRGTLIAVEGNFQDIVYTTPLFKASIQAIYSEISKVKDVGQSVYNMSEGAQLKEMQSQKAQNVNLAQYKSLDKQNIYSSLKTLLLAHSIEKIDIEHEKSFLQRYSYILNVKKELDDCFSNISYVEPEKYVNKLMQFLIEISKDETRESVNIREVYYSYFLYMLPIVVDFFNIKGLSNKKQHLKKIDAIVKKELYFIQSSYEDAVNIFMGKQKIKDTLSIQKIIKIQKELTFRSYAELLDSKNKLIAKLGESTSLYSEFFNSLKFLKIKFSEDQDINTMNKEFYIELFNELSIYINELSTYKEPMFIESINERIEIEEIKDQNMKNSIGFLAIKENIESVEFIAYIKELMSRFKQIKVKFICFNDEIDKQVRELFLNDADRIERVEPIRLHFLSQEIEVFISTHNTPLDYSIFNKLRLNFNIVTIHYSSNAKNYTIGSVVNLHKSNSHPLLEDPNYFGFSQVDLKEKDYSIHRVLYEDFMGSIHFNENLFEFVYFRLFSELLKNEALRSFYIAHMRKEAQKIK